MLINMRTATDMIDTSNRRVSHRSNSSPLPETIKEGTVLVQVTHMSMDPTHFVWTQDIPQYMPAVGLGTIMYSNCRQHFGPFITFPSSTPPPPRANAP